MFYPVLPDKDMLRASSSSLWELGGTTKQGHGLPQFSPAMTLNCKHTHEITYQNLHIVSAPVCRAHLPPFKKKKKSVHTDRR